MSLNVLMAPKNHEYINSLVKSLNQQDVKVKTLKPFHWGLFGNLIDAIAMYHHGCRIIHIHWLYIFPMAWMMKLFVIICKYFKIKIVWEVHNILPHGAKKTDYLMTKWFFKHIDGAIYHSRDDIHRSKKKLSEIGPKLFTTVPHANFNDAYPNNISASKARSSLGIPHNNRVILCFGFIRENRGYEYLIKSVENYKDMTILIVGKVWDKDTYNSVKKSIQNKPNFRLITGWIPNQEIQIYFNACDVVVLPYTDITTSGVIPLAYAFKKPVVASAIGGIKDVVSEKTGILVPPKDSVALRKAINSIFTKDIANMGIHAYEFAQNELSWEKSAGKIKNLYVSLLKGVAS